MAYKRNRDAFEADLEKHESPYVLYGTPLPPLDADTRDDGSYVPIWQQEVRDEKGRKRLHGAFTGGFSAGYFNTVGSKEGWTPSAFVSSRSAKAGQDGAKAQQQKIDDFMDDEDRADAEESRQLRTAGNFGGLGDTANDPMQLDHMANLLKPSGDTMGIKLLQRMGWKQGQGIGPKVRRRARIQDNTVGEDDGQVHLFAPEDSRMIAFNQKADTKGLGFASENLTGGSRKTDPWQDEEEDEQEESMFRPSARKQLTLNRKKPNTKRGGIGIGISTGMGSDDEDDPYSIGPKMTYNRSIGPNKAGTGDEVIKPILVKSSQTRPTFVARRKSLKQIEPTDLRTCHDGRRPIDGFVLATAALESMTIYDPPEIPAGWTSSRGKSEAEKNSSAFQSTADAAKSSTLDPKKRANLLGEEALPGKSVFDFLSEEARARIVAATGRADIPQARGEALPGVSEKPRGTTYLIPELDRDTAAAALVRSVSGWTPYGEDLGKRRRYLAFIELRAGLRETLPEREAGTTLDAWAQEMREFAHAAQVFKPVSGLMASRFTSSARTFEGSKADEERDKSSTDDSNPSLLSKPTARPEDPAVTAAKMGMFGPMTRSVIPFYPTRLVCKRFNVRPPENVQIDPGASADGGVNMSAPSTKVKDVVSRVTLDRLLQDAAAQQLHQKASTGGSNSGPSFDVAGAMKKLDEKPIVVDVERNEALEDVSKRPGDAVFRAIFGDGDDSDDE